jgi:hypothetical protein
MKSVGAAALALLLLTACSNNSEPAAAPTDAVLYTIGLSTNPYGESDPGGFGVATSVLGDELHKVEIRRRGVGGFGGAEWLDSRSIVVARPAPPLRRPLIYRYDEGLEQEGDAPIPGGANFEWSPQQQLFTYEPIEPCGRGQRSTYACYRGTGQLYVVGRDGSGLRRVRQGHLVGWTADGRLAFFPSLQRAAMRALDIETRRVGPILAGWKPSLPLPAWSPDRRFVAAVVEYGVLVARADGRVVQTIPSKLTISMLAWSPVANRLAFTTSGFPDPHQLFVVDRPGDKPRLLYATGEMHFDWVTWSPDGRWLLLDEEHMHRWLLLRTDRSRGRRSLPRLGGRPLWCCPTNAYLDSG